MDGAYQPVDWRVRAATFSTSALLVALACVALWWFSRTIMLSDGGTASGVDVFIAERTPPPRPTTQRPPPTSVPHATSAPPQETDLAIGRAMLSRTLACSDPRPDRRPAGCPGAALPRYGEAPELPATGGFGEPEPLHLNRAFTQAEQATLLTPSCKRDGGPPGMISACMTIGRDPPPPSRSAEEICDAGGLGPCHPPEFREEDVIHRAHTD